MVTTTVTRRPPGSGCPGRRRSPDPVDVEDPLGDDCARHQGTEVGADEGDDRDQRVAHDVQADHPPARQALGRRGAHVVRRAGSPSRLTRMSRAT